jgi:Co/Zn/Cd efflux system component
MGAVRFGLGARQSATRLISCSSGFHSRADNEDQMAAECCGHDHSADPHRDNPAFRRVVCAVLAINAVMFAVEIGAGVAAGSASLQADAVDFLGDAANYAISLFVVGMALRYRAAAALAKGATMGLFGLWVVATVIWHAVQGTLPSAFAMGAVGAAALAANAASFGLLWAHRGGDANMRSAWICTRNDVLGNVAVLLAALGVFGTGTGWPDVTVASIMAALAVQGSWLVVRRAMIELRQPPAAVDGKTAISENAVAFYDRGSAMTSAARARAPFQQGREAHECAPFCVSLNGGGVRPPAARKAHRSTGAGAHDATPGPAVRRAPRIRSRRG